MARTEVYERILQQLENGELSEIEKKVYTALRRVFPASLTRYDLIEAVFGYRPAKDENLNNNTDDRKIRTAIASMINKDVPIASHSGAAGYAIEIDLNVWNTTIVDLESHKESFEQKIASTKRIVRRLEEAGRNAIPTDVPETPKQLSLLEMN